MRIDYFQRMIAAPCSRDSVKKVDKKYGVNRFDNSFPWQKQKNSSRQLVSPMSHQRHTTTYIFVLIAAHQDVDARNTLLLECCSS
jgi:hypothetical protein